jgi:hypothetical protein
MSDHYPSNANNPPQKRPQRPPRERPTAVVHGVQIRKKPLLDRIQDRGVGIFKDVVFEVVGPYFRDMFADSFYAAIDRAFYPQGGSRSRGPRPGGGGHHSPSSNMTASGFVVTDYNSQYIGGAPQQSHVNPYKPFDFSQYTFPDYAAGRELIDRLTHYIHSYGHATVNDLYDLMGMSGTADHTGENYGWQGLESLAGVEIRRVRGGGSYYLDIPDARPLQK